MARKKDKPAKKKLKSERDPWTPWGKWAKRRRERRERRRREREERKRQRRLRWQRRVRRTRLFTTRSVVFVGLGLFACLIGLLVILVIGQPYPWQTFNDVTSSIQALRQLEDNQDRWQSLGITHYTIEVEYVAEGAICGPVRLEVRDGQIVDPPEEGDLWLPAETCNQRLTVLTVEGAFGQLDTLLGDFSPAIDSLRVQFNEEFGYVSWIEAGTYADDPPANCCWRAEWSGLRPINDNVDR
jgi:hypothetical protein